MTPDEELRKAVGLVIYELAHRDIDWKCCISDQGAVDILLRFATQQRIEEAKVIRDTTKRFSDYCDSNSRFTDGDILIIRERVASGMSRRQVARELGCSRTAINCIVSGNTWKHIPIEPPSEAS